MAKKTSIQVRLTVKALRAINDELTPAQKYQLSQLCNISNSTLYNYLGGSCARVDKGLEIVEKGTQLVNEAVERFTAKTK